MMIIIRTILFTSVSNALVMCADRIDVSSGPCNLCPDGSVYWTN